jgi:hypothetical protein
MRNYASECAQRIWSEEGILENFFILNSRGWSRGYNRIPLKDPWDEEALMMIRRKRLTYFLIVFIL